MCRPPQGVRHGSVHRALLQQLDVVRELEMVGLPIATVVSAGLVFLAVTLGTISLALILEFWRERNVKRAALRRLQGFGLDIADASESAKSLLRGDAASVGRLQALVV